MKKQSRIFFLLAVCGILTLSGCRKKIDETESETQSETVTESETEKQTQKKTEKTTEKKTPTTQKSTEKKTVKPSTVNGNTPTGQTNRPSTTPETEAAGTEMCPYCFQQISLAPTDSGSTIYAEHVAQEKAWADTYGWGDTPPTNTPTTGTPSTDAPATDAPSTDGNTDDSAQCGYCYQWFSVSDGSYAAHIAAHNEELGLPSGTEYITCPKCGYSFPKGSLYDNHVCVSD
ncbi:MAG: hypothetical protein ACOX8M_01540 [Marvinbryantia sp.]|jgi:hypothetical protein